MNIIQGCPWPQEHHLGESLCPRGTSGGVLVPIWGIPGPSCGGVPILNEHHLEVSLSPETSFRGVPDPRSITWGVAMSSGSVILGCPHPQGHCLGVSLSHEHHLGVSLYPGGTSGGVHLPMWGVPIPRSVILGCPYTLLGVSLSPGASFEGCPRPQEGLQSQCCPHPGAVRVWGDVGPGCGSQLTSCPTGAVRFHPGPRGF